MEHPKNRAHNTLITLASTIIILHLLISSTTSSAAGKAFVGINYGRIADDLPPPSQVVKLLLSQNITRIKLYDSDPTVLSALIGTQISVTVALPNENLSAAANRQSFVDSWIKSSVLPYLSNVEAIAVGNEVFVDPNNTTSFLVPAMQNVYDSLLRFNASSSIKVSSPVALTCLENSYPPSSGSFRHELVDTVIKPMLDFLRRSESYMMVNAYPFFAYSAHPDTIPLDYAARFNGHSVDQNNGLVYTSMLEAQVDAVYNAMEALGFGDVRVVVSETGWPSRGDADEVGANTENAASYNGNLVRRVLTNGGTPLKPGFPLSVYLFALFNEDGKSGPTSERNYGLFYPDEKKVYDVSLTMTAARDGHVVAGDTWCVASGNAGEERLREAMEYACGEGGADCRPIEVGATCHDPDTVVAHASYAFNSYYQRKMRARGSCYFGGAAYVVTQEPKFGSCIFPVGD